MVNRDYHFPIADWYGLPYIKRLKNEDSGTSWYTIHGYRTAEMLPEVPESEPIRTEGQLVKELLSGYQKRGRPVSNVSYQLSFKIQYIEYIQHSNFKFQVKCL